MFHRNTGAVPLVAWELLAVTISGPNCGEGAAHETGRQTPPAVMAKGRRS